MLVTRDETSRSHEPREDPLDKPASLVAPELATVLVLKFSGAVIGRDHVDAALAKCCIELVAVVGLVAD